MRFFEHITGNRKIISCISLLMVMSMTFAGCGKKPEENIPELIEPVSTNSAYRPVTYGDIGKLVIKTASVVPTEHCYFYNTNVNLSKIYVNVGDYVEEGTVLAEADADNVDYEADSESESLSQKKSIHEIEQYIFSENQKELDWKIKACEEVGDEDGAAEFRLQKATAAENNRYDNMLYEYQINKTQKSLDEKNELQENGTLTADHAGYVTYVKNITSSDDVSGGENVVIVSDTEEPYIEIPGEQVKKGAYDVFNNMYTIIDGKKYDIELYNYTNQELAVAQSMSSVPNVRFKLKGGDKKPLKTGNTLSLYFSTSEVTNVLIVGNDSLYEENGQSFVYVKTEDNDKERRDITIGKSDENYTQVVDGLKEGELVYYASDSVMPSSYVEYNISLSNFNNISTSKNYTMDDTNMVTYSAPCEGYFTSLNVTEGQEVKKGDLLCVIDSGGGSAEVKELDRQIAERSQEYNDTIYDYDEQITALSQQISDWESGKLPEKKASPDTPDEANTLYMAEQLTCQRQVLSYRKQIETINYNADIASLNKQKEKLNKNNDGSGNISVYADMDGHVKKVYVEADKKLEEGTNIVSIGSEENLIMALSLSGDSDNNNRRGGGDEDGASGSSEGTATLKLNQTVTLVNKNDESIKYQGKCIGSTADTSRVYITTDKEGTVHVTKSSGDGEIKYYIEVEDKKFYDAPDGYSVRYAKTSLENVVMIPNNMIYHEVAKTNGREYDYVWKIMDGQL
ncbi:MAG: biotin/lipoyl-binding protein, partial [Coprococcus sp.]